MNNKGRYIEAKIAKCSNCGFNYDIDLIQCPKCDFEEKEIFIYNKMRNRKIKF